MTAFGWTLIALLSHWRRRPMQLAALLVGLAAATALWSGVQALNAQARASYDDAASALGGGAVLESRGGGAVAQADFVALRLAGWPVSPVLEGRVTIAGRPLRVLGVEPLSLPRAAAAQAYGRDDGAGDARAALAAFLIPPGRSWVAPETLAALGLSAGAAPEARAQPPGAGAANGGSGSALRMIPPLDARPGMRPGLLVMDIGAAQRVLASPGVLSRLLVDPQGWSRDLARLAVIAPGLTSRQAPGSGDLARLAESFHMNLSAFGLLSFLVGLFIVHAAIGLAFEQRLPMLRTLRACGVAARTLTLALLAELLTLALIAGLAGTLGGYFIAAALLDDVAASLHGLYGATIDGALTLRAAWWLAGMGISVAGALLAALGGLARVWRMAPLEAAAPRAWRRAQETLLRRQGLGALAALVAGGLAPLAFDGLLAGFALMAGLMLGAALALPLALDRCLRWGARRRGSALTQWAWADSRQQLPGLSLALMALLMALAANVGVGTMVEGFRVTFVDWLEDRLAPEIYLRVADPGQAAALEAWLATRAEVRAVLPAPRAETRIGGLPVELYGFADHPTYRDRWPLLSARAGVWDDLARGEAAVISEQLARRLDLDLGDMLALPAPGGAWPVRVGGIFADYGNPKGQVRVAAGALLDHWPDADRTRYGLRLAPEAVPALMAALDAALSPARMLDQAGLKAQSRRIFEKTFAVTGALNALTLGVAAIALFASLTTLAASRLPQLAPLWAIGLGRRRLAALELAKTLGLALATVALAIPLGIAVAWVLVAVVNVEAFGWRLPLRLFPLQWLELGALALGAALVAAGAPMWRLSRMPPAELAKAFANER